MVQNIPRAGSQDVLHFLPSTFLCPWPAASALPFKIKLQQILLSFFRQGKATSRPARMLNCKQQIRQNLLQLPKILPWALLTHYFRFLVLALTLIKTGRWVLGKDQMLPVLDLSTCTRVGCMSLLFIICGCWPYFTWILDTEGREVSPDPYDFPTPGNQISFMYNEMVQSQVLCLPVSWGRRCSINNVNIEETWPLSELAAHSGCEGNTETSEVKEKSKIGDKQENKNISKNETLHSIFLSFKVFWFGTIMTETLTFCKLSISTYLICWLIHLSMALVRALKDYAKGA